MVKTIQILAFIIGLFTYLFWNVILKKFDIPIFYIGNALFLFLLCVLSYINLKNLFSFLLICLSLNNLLDELFFDNTKTSTNEIFLALTLPFFWFIIKKYNARKSNKQ